MTIQTDLNEIEKGCSKSFNFYAKESMCYINLNCGQWKEITSTWNKMEWCEVCKAKRQTFIEENLKRINEMIELKKMIEELEYAEYNVTETRINALMRIYKKFDQLKADKQFLEEKRNGN